MPSAPRSDPRCSASESLPNRALAIPTLDCTLPISFSEGRPRQGQIPECGVVEVKPVGDDAWLTAESDQVSKYWDRYRLVLVTNTRDFVLVGEDVAGNPVTAGDHSGWRTRWTSSRHVCRSPASSRREAGSRFQASTCTGRCLTGQRIVEPRRTCSVASGLLRTGTGWRAWRRQARRSSLQAVRTSLGRGAWE